MLMELISSFAKGAVTSLSIGSPAEWAVHKYILHAKQPVRNKIKYIDNASLGHHDNHHGAYKGPEHYYRDITNEKEVIHFAKRDVGIIAGVSGAIGGAIATCAHLNSNALDLKETFGYSAGFLTGAMSYYLAYEFTHHYMHVIGERRLEINRVLGDILQGGKEKRDGNLRISKPLLDEICNSIEKGVDDWILGGERNITNKEDLSQVLKMQFDQNKNNRIRTNLNVNYPDEILDDTSRIILEREYEYNENLDTCGKVKHYIDRKVQSTLRNSPAFQYIDNHHFFHHFKYNSNLNVVFPLMDFIASTKEDSSKKRLTQDTRLWLCPNSPDTLEFKRKVNSKINQMV